MSKSHKKNGNKFENFFKQVIKSGQTVETVFKQVEHIVNTLKDNQKRRNNG